MEKGVFMKKFMMACLVGITLVFSACAHKHGSADCCKDGACKMEKKDCAHCGTKKDDAKTEEKK